MICEEREGDRACEMVSFTLEYFFYSSTALLPFAVSLITHGLLLLRSSQKKYYSISGCSLQHLYFVISPGVSCPLVFFTLPFSSVVSVLKDWCQVINFTSGEKKSQSKPMVYFIDKSIPPYFLQNLWNISAQCSSVCQLLKCQSSIMEKEEKDQNSFHLRNCS